MKKFLLLTAAILAIQAIPALAQEGGAQADGKKQQRENSMFEEQDTNKDGVVSEDEFLAFGKKRFSEIDADKNGSITKEEAKKYHESKKAKWKEKREEMKSKRESMKEKPKSE